ncbi:Lectin C-type domain-containing protein [Fulvimarina manganoxydans]|uniref:Lectin C-type domain-containing protein n=1 Tax=Fulvimarina manganoxydans TaxID=937218 RepID=A0A1W2EJP1_9HYPH|nr:Ig-like domain-containing protein [Fulvimarina manganoxydans]SMD09894.1 Lectin C-type domain-containing protein [Fulvimarina manganoxydans]
MDQQFIIELYNRILFREPTQGEIDAAVIVLGESGENALEESLSSSDEAVTLETVVLPIIGLYQAFLVRTPDVAGLRFWSEAISAGEKSFADLIDTFTNSSEFPVVNPGIGTDPTSDEIVNLFYSNILGRAPDNAGFAFWKAALDSGSIDAGFFARSFLASNESDSTVGAALRTYLADLVDGVINDPENRDSLLVVNDGGGDDVEDDEGPVGGNPDSTADEGDDLALSLPDDLINAGESKSVKFDLDGLDSDLQSAVVTFTDQNGATVEVDGLRTSVADISALSDGEITVSVRVFDGFNAAIASGGTIVLDKTPPIAPTLTVSDTGPVQGVTNAASPIVLTDNESDASVEYSVNDGVFSATLPTFVDGTEYTVVARQTDQAGNVSANSDAVTFIYDTSAPTVAVSDNGDGLLKAGEETTLTFTFSETPYGFEASDIVVPAVAGEIVADSLSAPTTNSDGTVVYTAVFRAAADTYDAAATISVADAAYTDRAGNDGTGGSVNVDVDAVAPIAPTLTVSDTGPVQGVTNAASPIVLTDNESDASVEYSVNDGVFSATLPTFVDGTEYTVVARQTDQAGNVSANSDAVTFIYDTSAPTVAVSDNGDGLLKAGEETTLTFTFSETPYGFEASDIVVPAVAGEIVADSLSAPTTNSDGTVVYTAVFRAAADTYDAAATISVADAAYTDRAGNDGTGGSVNVDVDAAAPLLTIAAANDVITAGGQTVISFIFNESPVDFAREDITVTDGRGSLGALSEVMQTADGFVYTATFTADDTAQRGDVRFGVIGSAYTDQAGNAGNSASAAVTVSARTLEQIMSDDGYLKFDGNGHYYKALNTVSSFQDALSAASSAGAALVTVTADGENDFVKDILVSSQNAFAWLAGKQNPNEGAWKWVDGLESGKQFAKSDGVSKNDSYTKWDDGEPSNGVGTEYGPENYLGMWGDYGKAGLWNDFSNTYGPGLVIAEVDNLQAYANFHGYDVI